MTEPTRRVIQRHWDLANERQWDKFAELLADELRYEVPQTREYIESGEGYLEMFRTWPGNWRAKIKELMCDGNRAICVVDFIVDNESVTGISIFEVHDGKLVSVTDYWPEPYEPPPRNTSALKRRPRDT